MLPEAYCEANRLGRAWLKSYSGMISSRSSRPAALLFLRAFSIVSPLTAGRPPRANQANGLAAFREHDGKEAASSRTPQQDLPFFLSRVPGVANDEAQRIAENARGFLE
jgi:hypothetical protein